jgi:hypothetical protein
LVLVVLAEAVVKLLAQILFLAVLQQLAVVMAALMDLLEFLVALVAAVRMALNLVVLESQVKAMPVVQEQQPLVVSMDVLAEAGRVLLD